MNQRICVFPSLWYENGVGSFLLDFGFFLYSSLRDKMGRRRISRAG